MPTARAGAAVAVAEKKLFVCGLDSVGLGGVRFEGLKNLKDLIGFCSVCFGVLFEGLNWLMQLHKV